MIDPQGQTPSNDDVFDEFVHQCMQIDGVHGVGTSDNDTVLHIYASKTRAVTSWMKYQFPPGIDRWVVHRCAKPRPA